MRYRIMGISNGFRIIVDELIFLMINLQWTKYDDLKIECNPIDS